MFFVEQEIPHPGDNKTAEYKSHIGRIEITVADRKTQNKINNSRRNRDFQHGANFLVIKPRHSATSTHSENPPRMPPSTRQMPLDAFKSGGKRE